MVSRELRFLVLDARVRFELRGDRLVERVREICPELRKVDGEIAFAPSVLLALVVYAAVPVGMLLGGSSLTSVLIALGVGRFAMGLARRRLAAFDAAHALWWAERAGRHQPRAERVVRTVEAVADRSLRSATVVFLTGVVLAAGSGIVAVAPGTAPMFAWVLALPAVALLMAAAVLVCVQQCAMLVLLLAPTVTAAGTEPDSLVTRADMATLRPLLETRPVRHARSAWELLRLLKP